VEDISASVDETVARNLAQSTGPQREQLIDDVARRHVQWVIENIRQQSSVLRELEQAGKIQLVGAMYDIQSGRVEFNVHERRKISSSADPQLV